jgi:hypothetical protein
MGFQPVLDSVMHDEFDIIFGRSAYYGQDSRPVASKVLQYLLDKRMVIWDQSNAYRWMYMFPRCEDLETYETLPSEYVACPNFHAGEVPKLHEERVATLIETIARIAHSVDPRPSGSTPLPRRVRSFHDKLVGERRKPDIAILQDVTDIVANRVRVHWHHIACVGEIKYANKETLKSDAEVALTDASWFALQSTFGRRYVVTFSLCGPILVMCMVDHSGKVTPLEVDMEKNTVEWIQCIIAVTMGPDEMLGDDRSINAFRFIDVPPTHPRYVGHIMRLAGEDYVLQARLFHTPSAIGSATSIYSATLIDKESGTPGNQIAIKDFWPTPNEPFESDYLKYIHRVLEEKRSAGILNLPPSIAFPTPIADELVTCTDPRNGRQVVDSTALRRRVSAMAQVNYEHRVHYRIGFRDVVVDLTWFATRQEYFEAILGSLEGVLFAEDFLSPITTDCFLFSCLAHQFAAEHCQVLHKDITPNNIFLVVDAATAEQACPGFGDRGRKYQLGDWGLSVPLQNFNFVAFNFKQYRVQDAQWDQFIHSGGHSGVTELKSTSSTYRKNHDQFPMAPNEVFNRTVR